jgi:beta-glucanase (GH16 family)
VKALGLAALLLTGCGGAPATPPLTPIAADEFDGPAGAAPDPRFWSFEVGGGGFGNAELEFNTDRSTNAALDGAGNLVITARREEYQGRSFTSARLSTRALQQVAYGRVEARMKLPRGQGLWPAFWLLGANISEVGWPNCGEIDVMESRGAQPALAYGSLHGPGYSGGGAISNVFRAAAGATLADAMHVYAAEWDPDEVRWSVDGVIYGRAHATRLRSGQRWVLDGHPFFVVLDLAVGGNYGGAPDATTPFPQSLLVDYVRLFAHAPEVR